jgi:ArsR family transcriptional regulator, cadmium/lead-responsive transcriptional repressor
MGRPGIVESQPTPLHDEELVARLFRALGDATRLSIVEFLLDHGPQPQKVIVDQVGLSQGQVSQHLTCLVWCGFLVSTKLGRETHYEVASPRVAAIVDLGRRFLGSTNGDIATCRINK